MLKRSLAALTLLCVATGANAQDFPSKHITLVMPYAAGGPGDTMARIVGQGMSTAFKQQVIVENIAGAGGTVGSARVSAAAPDGHTLLMIHVSAATNPALYPNIKYDQTKDFEPIGLVVDLPSAFVAKKDFAPNTFAEMVAYIKANKDKVNYAHAGIGSASHLCGMLFSAAIDTKFTQVAYRGTGPAMNDMLGGQVDFMCDQAVNVVSNVTAGTIKGYAVTSLTKAPALPTLPTADAAGLKGFDLTIWYGLWASKGTPKPIVDKLVAGLQAALKDEGVKAKLAVLGADAVSSERATPAALDAHLKAETAKWGALIKAAGVTAAP
jgi:tripartite-type tricarboxylate transporter receptor subunit TctC